MLETNPEEIREAVDSLGDGTHKMKDIENEIIRLRHLRITIKKKKPRKKN